MLKYGTQASAMIYLEEVDIVPHFSVKKGQHQQSACKHKDQSEIPAGDRMPCLDKPTGKPVKPLLKPDEKRIENNGHDGH
jgi:hypothetical protein